MIQNLNSGQIKAISAIAKRLINGIINPARRDIHILENNRLLLKTLISNRITGKGKRSLLLRHHNLVLILVRPCHVIETIVHEIQSER